jgi:hypothetical protein
MLRIAMAVVIFIGPSLAYCQGDAAPATQQASPQPEAPQDKEARLKQLVDLLKTFSDQDYQSALKQSGADTSGHPELVSRNAALKTGYTTLAALEYHEATQDAPKDSAAKYSKAYKHIVEKDAALVAINPDTMQETGRWMDILKGAALVALKYGITAAIMAAGQEIPSPQQAQREGAIDKYQGQLAGADLTSDQKSQLHYQLGSQYEQTAADIGGGDGSAPPVPPSPQDQLSQLNQSLQSAAAAGAGPMDQTQTRMLQIVNFLSAISDKDYQGAMGQAIQLIPTKGQRPPLLVSRAAALQATYDSMAALQYKQAAQRVPGDAGAKYSQAYQHAVNQDAAAAAIDGQNVQQTGWAMDVFKFLGNAAINYELNGGQVYVGRQVRSPEARKLDKQIDDLQAQLADKNISPDKQAELYYKLGAAYEGRAAACAAPETAEEMAAKKEARVKQLASLLQSVSDDDYKQAAQMAGVDKSGAPGLTSRSAALKTTYTTMAGFEYHQASKQAPKQAGYSSDYKRVAGEDAQNLAINPDTLQETGWFTDLLGLAALGGAGYAIYNATKNGGHGGQSSPAPVPAPVPSPAGCPAGSTATGNGGCSPVNNQCLAGMQMILGQCLYPVSTGSSVFSPSVVVSAGASANSTSNIGRAMARDSAGNLYLAYLKSYAGSERIFVARSANGGASWSDTTSVPVDNSGCPQVGNPVLAIDGSDVLWLGAISNVPGGCTYGRMGVISAPAPGTQWSAWQIIQGSYPYVGYETAAGIAVAGDNSVHLIWSGQDRFAPSGYSYGYVVRHASYIPGTGGWSPYSLVPGGDGSANVGLNAPVMAIDGTNTLHVVSRQYGPSQNAPAKLVHSSVPVVLPASGIFQSADYHAPPPWSAPETVVDLTAGGLDQENPSLAVDSQNNLQLVWDGQDASNQSYQVKYAVKKAGGTWSAWTNILPKATITQRDPSLAVDSIGGLNAVWIEQAPRGGCQAPTKPGQVECFAIGPIPPATLQCARDVGGSWSAVANPIGAAIPQGASTTARWAGFRDNGGDMAIAWTQTDGTARYAQAPAVAMLAGFGSATPAPGPNVNHQLFTLVATGRGVNSAQSADALDEQLASDDFNPAEGAKVHHQLGKVYEQLAMAAVPEVSAAPEPVKRPKAKPAPVVEKPAEKPQEATEAAETPQPSAEELRQQGEKDLEDTGKKMDQDAQQRIQQLQQH